MDKNIPYIAFEAEMARHEREKLRLIKALIVAIMVIFISNIAWLWFFNQFDYSTDTITQGTEQGDNSYMGAGASIINGESKDN